MCENDVRYVRNFVLPYGIAYHYNPHTDGNLPVAFYTLLNTRTLLDVINSLCMQREAPSVQIPWYLTTRRLFDDRLSDGAFLPVMFRVIRHSSILSAPLRY